LNILFDSSVLVAVFYGDHPHHEPSLRAFLTADKTTACCALRTLGEVFVTLTGLPLRPRITGPEAALMLDEICRRVSLVSLTQQEYRDALSELATTPIVGSATYDFLIAKCAVKEGADVILTWNARDFLRFGAPIASKVRTPSELRPPE
jgi:predicted nucleic acid-binding protein